MSHPVIILCGGDINHSNLPIATNVSNAMIPVNGKPVIGWILNDLLEKDIREVVLVVQEESKKLIQFVEWAFNGRLKISLATLHKRGSILQSLHTGLEKLAEDQPVTVLLGDTLIKDPFFPISDYVLVSTAYDDPRNWCLVETDEQQNISQYFDKQDLHQKGLAALTGLYHFSSQMRLKASCIAAIGKGQNELSAALSIYSEFSPIKAVETKQWYDFGHISHFLEAKKALLQSRFFNQLRIDNLRGTIEKTSNKTEKLRDEFNWFDSLPQELKIFTPRLISQHQENGKFTVIQEYYGYPNLAELYLFGNFDFEIWRTAIKNLLSTHDVLSNYATVLKKEDLEYMYWGKTLSRLKELESENGFFQKTMQEETILVNDQVWLNLPRLLPKIEQQAKLLSLNTRGSIIHGDYCLSNILYDINSQVVRLIDPRGSFGTKGIYGDPRYDIAKLRHSFNGCYDYMVADLFGVKHQKGIWKYQICHHELYKDIADLLDREIVALGYNLKEIRFIEGLLFLSMIPLHKDKPQRQKIMYLRALYLFNQMFKQSEVQTHITFVNLN